MDDDSKLTFMPRIVSLEIQSLFDRLSKEEKLLAYYLNRASWEAAPILLFQTSYESPAIFLILQKFFCSMIPFENIKTIIMQKANMQVTDVDYKFFIRYASMFYSNMGNFCENGKVKIIPSVSSQKFEEILKTSEKYTEIKYIWDCVKELIYDTSYIKDQKKNRLKKNNFYLGDIKEEEVKHLDKFLFDNNISTHNTRLMKHANKKLVYLVTSIMEMNKVWTGTNIVGHYGEFRAFLERVNGNLINAIKYTTDESQIKAFSGYIEFFKSGDFRHYEDAHRNFIESKSPTIDLSFGWTGNGEARSKFLGISSILDRAKSEKFIKFCESIHEIIVAVPWPPEFEKKNFDDFKFALAAVDAISIPYNEDPKKVFTFKLNNFNANFFEFYGNSGDGIAGIKIGSNESIKPLSSMSGAASVNEEVVNKIEEMRKSDISEAIKIEDYEQLRNDLTSIEIKDISDISKSGKFVENNLQEILEEKKAEQDYFYPREDDKENRFKNLFLLNNFDSWNEMNSPLILSDDIVILEKYSYNAYLMKFAVSEMLGKGSGEFLKKNEDGGFNFDIENLINPLTNEKIKTWYESYQTYESKFAELAEVYTICRAELCSLYFLFFLDIFKIFDLDESYYDNTIYAMWIIFIREALLSLKGYNTDTNKWNNPNESAIWLIVNFLLNNQINGQELATLQINLEKKTFKIAVNKNALLCSGQELLTKMLLPIHIWRSTGDIDSAREFYQKYSIVDSKFFLIRDFIMENTLPFKRSLQCNLFLLENSQVIVKKYPQTLEGIIESFVERYGTNINTDLYNQWTRYDTYNFLKNND